MLSFLKVVLAAWALAVVLLWLFQERALFPLRGDDPGAPPPWSGFVLAGTTTPDGLALRFWAAPPKPGMPVILYFHGNGGTGADRMSSVQPLVREGYGVVLAEYRGYGGNPGSPSGAGLLVDVRAQRDWARATWPGAPLVPWGESLGTGLATALAAEGGVSGVVLDAPYTSIRELAAAAVRWAPTGLLLRHPFESLRHVEAIDAPILVMHGEADLVIPVSHGRRILEAARCRTEAVILPGVGHTAFLAGPDLSPQALAFLGSLRDKPDGCPRGVR